MNIKQLLSKLAIDNPFPEATADPTKVETVLQIVFSITGAVSLLIISIAGFRYIISQGEPQAVAKAKNTIIYAAIGLGISMLAVAIVSYIARSVAP